MATDQLLIISLVILVIIGFGLLSFIDLFASFVIYITLLPFTNANYIISFRYFDISPSYMYGLIIIVAWLSRLNIGKLNKKLKGSLKIIIAAFIISFIISIFSSPMLDLGIKELAKHLFFIAMVIVAVDLVTSEFRGYYLMKWWFISICIVSGLCLLMFILGIKPLPGYLLTHGEGFSFSVTKLEYDFWRISSGEVFKNLNIGLGNNPDKLAGLNFIGILLGIGLIRYNKKKQSILIILISMLMVNLLLTFTRSAWLAAIIGIIWIIYSNMRRGGKKIQALALVPFLTIIPAAIILVEPLNTRYALTFEGRDNSEYGRQFMWNNLLTMVEENPLTGVGPGVSLTHLGQIAFEEGLMANMESKVSGHNVILTLWAELGILGLLTFCSLIYLGLFGKRRGAMAYADRGENFEVLLESFRAALLAWTFFMCFHPEYTPWFWVLLGIAIGLGTGVKIPKTDLSYAHPHYSGNYRHIYYDHGNINHRSKNFKSRKRY